MGITTFKDFIAPLIEGIGIIHFTDADIVRHPLVSEVVRAYDRESARIEAAKAEALRAKAELARVKSGGWRADLAVAQAKLAYSLVNIGKGLETMAGLNNVPKTPSV